VRRNDCKILITHEKHQNRCFLLISTDFKEKNSLSSFQSAEKKRKCKFQKRAKSYLLKNNNVKHKNTSKFYHGHKKDALLAL
jgi:hypothetical protein